MFKVILVSFLLVNGACAQSSSIPVSSTNAPPISQGPGPTISVSLPQPTKTIGKASVYYDQGSKRSTAKVSFYVVGRAEYIQKEDVLSVETSVDGPGKESMKPESVFFRFYSYSHGAGYKYKEDAKLTMYLNGIWFLTGVCQSSFAAIDPRGGVAEEYFSPRVSFEQFMKLLSGGTISMKFGRTEFVIEGDNLGALEDLAEVVSGGR
jgi:hypothetical protein